MTCIVIAIFDRRREVDLVVEHLVQEFDVSRDRVQVHAIDAADAAGARSPQDSELERKLSLPSLGLPEKAVRAYEAGMRRGGILVAAWVGDGHVERAMRAYREYGATSCYAHEAEVSDETGHG